MNVHRYPFLTSEIFGADITPLLNTFFMSKEANLNRKSDNNATLESFNSDRADENYDLARKSMLNGRGRGSEERNEENKSVNEQSERIFQDSEYENNHSSPATEIIKPQSLLDYLFKFVETDSELNSVLCGYFNKLVSLLMKRNPKKVSALLMK